MWVWSEHYHMMNYMSILKEIIPQSYLQKFQNLNIFIVVTYYNTTACLMLLISWNLYNALTSYCRFQKKSNNG